MRLLLIATSLALVAVSGASNKDVTAVFLDTKNAQQFYYKSTKSNVKKVKLNSHNSQQMEKISD